MGQYGNGPQNGPLPYWIPVDNSGKSKPSVGFARDCRNTQTQNAPAAEAARALLLSSLDYVRS